MSYTGNIDLIIAIRDLIKGQVSDIPIYDVVFPSYNIPEDLPDNFIIVKPITQFDQGNINTYGTIEVCLYARNMKIDTSLPDISTIKSMTDTIYPILRNGVKNKTAIRNIRDRIVSHSEIRYHYNSLLCETISIN